MTTIHTLQEDIARLRVLCCQIEAGLDVFDTIGVDPMTDEQSVRHELFLIRMAIDKVAGRAAALNVEYSYLTPLNQGQLL